MLDDTIAAIATPPGEGGIGIVRLSGPAAMSIAAQIFHSGSARNWCEEPGYRVYYGHIVEPESGKVVDEVLLTVMRAPRSYTREDVVEISGHGGVVPLRRILQIVLNLGARLAEPGEFTKRAFLNGRLDLAQAEAILDIIRSPTEASLRLAVDQLQGDLSREIKDLQSKLVAVLATIEAGIDFPEEDDVPETEQGALTLELSSIIAYCQELLAGAAQGRIYREGLGVAIIGKTNVGKSSLLNALLRENRAIVTEIPGTTRDVIEEMINIRGIPLRVLDTAGLRKTNDAVELIGVERTKETIKLADLILVVLDAATGLEAEDREVLNLVKEKRVLIVINKIDLGISNIVDEEVNRHLQAPILKISVEKKQGMSQLEEAIVDMVEDGQSAARKTPLVSNIRHQAALEKGVQSLEEAQKALEAQMPLEMVAIDIRSAMEAFGEVTGESVGEDLLDRIFQEFCIGK